MMNYSKIFVTKPKCIINKCQLAHSFSKMEILFRDNGNPIFK